MYIIYIVNLLLSQFHLEWADEKLIYSPNKYVEFIIPAKFDRVLMFLGIKIEMPYYTIKTVKEHFDLIKFTRYWNPDLKFSTYNGFKNYDHSFFEEFDYYTSITGKIGYGKIPIDNEFTKRIKIYFQSKTPIEPHELLPLKDKFNGHLAMQWRQELKPGLILKEVIENYREHVEENYHMPFNNFLILNSNKNIRANFIIFYSNLTELNMVNKLPF